MNRKYPRTFHFPFSPGATKDDRIATSVSSLLNVPIVITEKIDGSNSSLEKDGCFARTHSHSPKHHSFDGLKALHAQVKYLIPDNIQYFGEFVFARHSIYYSELPGYFLLFAVRNENIWVSWKDVCKIAQELNVPTVPVLWKGIIKSAKELEELTFALAMEPSACGGEREGVVVRIEDQFENKDFSKCVMKWVRAGHVATDTHWMHQEIIKNKLK